MAGHVKPPGPDQHTNTMIKFDYHIEGKVYQDGVTPKCGLFSIRLNTVVDEWTGVARVEFTGL